MFLIPVYLWVALKSIDWIIIVGPLIKKPHFSDYKNNCRSLWNSKNNSAIRKSDFWELGGVIRLRNFLAPNRFCHANSPYPRNSSLPSSAVTQAATGLDGLDLRTQVDSTLTINVLCTQSLVEDRAEIAIN